MTKENKQMYIMELDTNLDNYKEKNGNLTHFARGASYQVTYIDNLDEVLCPDCASQDIDEVKGAFIHWEGSSIYCAGCDREIESEYGEV